VIVTVVALPVRQQTYVSVGLIVEFDSFLTDRVVVSWRRPGAGYEAGSVDRRLFARVLFARWRG